MKLSERIRKWYSDNCGRKHQAVMDIWADEVAQLEITNAELLEACKSGERNTILLIEYAEPIYREHGHSLTAIAQAIRHAEEQAS